MTKVLTLNLLHVWGAGKSLINFFVQFCADENQLGIEMSIHTTSLGGESTA